MLKFILELLKAPIRARLHERRLWRAQAGQDFWVFGETFNERRSGYFVDIGAHDGVNISNTYILEKRYNWMGLCIEANPDTFRKLERNRTAMCVNACLDNEQREVIFVKKDVLSGIVSQDTDNRAKVATGDNIVLQTRRLEDVLLEHNAPAVIDYLTIDVEGAEDRVLLRFPFENYKISSMTIERPSIALRARLDAVGFCLVKEIPGLDCHYIHQSFMNTYLENAYAFYRKKYIALNMG